MTRRPWLRPTLNPTIAAITVVLVALSLAVLAVGVFAVRATDQAFDAAAEADRSTTCNELLLKAIALRRVTPEALAKGCDVQTAQTVIDRSRARDVEVQLARRRLADAAEARLALERQITELGRTPVTSGSVQSAPDVTVVVPSSPRPGASPTPGAVPTPPPSAAPTPTPRPTPSRTPAPVLGPTVCDLIRLVLC